MTRLRVLLARGGCILCLVPLLLGADDEEQRIGLQRLDDATRAKVLAALAGLIILGLAMVALIWLGARITRRYMNPPRYDVKRSPFAEFGVDDWAKKPVVLPDRSRDSEELP